MLQEKSLRLVEGWVGQVERRNGRGWGFSGEGWCGGCHEGDGGGSDWDGDGFGGDGEEDREEGSSEFGSEGMKLGLRLGVEEGKLSGMEDRIGSMFVTLGGVGKIWKLGWAGNSNVGKDRALSMEALLKGRIN